MYELMNVHTYYDQICIFIPTANGSRLFVVTMNLPFRQ